jgi:hypothetical protein
MLNAFESSAKKGGGACICSLSRSRESRGGSPATLHGNCPCVTVQASAPVNMEACRACPERQAKRRAEAATEAVAMDEPEDALVQCGDRQERFFRRH